MKEIKRISPKALANLEERVILDVRTPAEHRKAHIPGSCNLPLFSNEERAEIGTLYKQVSPREALLRGLELVGPKMRQLVERAEELAPKGQVLIHCWRGGNRSGSMAWLLDLAGFDVLILEGGYKAYRRSVRAYLENLPHRLLVLAGKTGVGKTDVLAGLAAAGRSTLDLEGLARHKGSAFGNLEGADQPSVEHFENSLHHRLQTLDPDQPVWVEHESRAIGRVYLPNGLVEKMAQSPFVYLESPDDLRVNRLVAQYGEAPAASLVDSFDRIRKRLGGQHHQRAVAAIEAGDLATAVRIALRYYDKAYTHYLQRDEPSRIITVAVSDTNDKQLIQQLIDLEQKIYEN